MNEPSHFDELISEQETTEKFTQQEEIRSVLTTPEDFHKMFVFGFNIGSGATGLKSLRTEPSDSSRVASAAIYDTCLEVPALRFMLDPTNKWIERGFAIGCFVVPMAQGVAAELDYKRREGSAEPKPPSSPSKKSKDGQPSADQISALTGV